MASEACHALYGEVAGYESQHIAELGRWHQLLVDTYAAQHAGKATPAMGTAFALIGLELALEEGRDGLEIRDAHQRLAAAFETWPRFEVPPSRGARTVFDLALAGSTGEHVERLLAWASDVWGAWSASHAAVRDLIRERLR